MNITNMNTKADEKFLYLSSPGRERKNRLALPDTSVPVEEQ